METFRKNIYVCTSKMKIPIISNLFENTRISRPFIQAQQQFNEVQCNLFLASIFAHIIDKRCQNTMVKLIQAFMEVMSFNNPGLDLRFQHWSEELSFLSPE